MTERAPGSFELAGRPIGGRHAVFVIAEIGLNHGGALETALALVDAVAPAGPAAVKLQSLRADRLVSEVAPAPAHVRSPSPRALFRRFELDEVAHRRVAGRAREHGMAFMSTPLDEGMVEMLERVGCDAYKIASGDVTFHPLIARVARTDKPLILSTGMSELEEIGDAVRCARAAGARQIALLHCVSVYPTALDQQNLGALADARTFDVPVGLSDHGTDPAAPVIATALGGCLYERHVRLPADDSAVDAAVSSTPDELAGIIEAIHRTGLALGDGRKQPMASERAARAASRRGLYAARDIAPGERITLECVIALRPATGVSPIRLSGVVGTTATRPDRGGHRVHGGRPPLRDPRIRGEQWRRLTSW